jgi:hypothetical protein
MSLNWGPHFIVPSESLKEFSGSVKLREKYDESLLHQELENLGLSGAIVKVTNPWYFRKKGAGTWVKIGESEDGKENFPVQWDTTQLEKGRYEVLGVMHVFVRKGGGEHVIARENIVEVTLVEKEEPHIVWSPLNKKKAGKKAHLRIVQQTHEPE